MPTKRAGTNAKAATLIIMRSYIQREVAVRVVSTILVGRIGCSLASPTSVGVDDAPSVTADSEVVATAIVRARFFGRIPERISYGRAPAGRSCRGLDFALRLGCVDNVRYPRESLQISEED